ncbi:hypothetical protein [Phosphitispora fastidiosa]|uniref:hypothetical protein n=1 Tax=Phosphitispora fastidiosa TaxID=2837202 RepID=UPI001E2967A1|nr:hypothetical protein [Phosphitispora fastidiosa]MBU7006293.1 hypothetical protein [Phosphitispora fastidiosa]
MDLAEILAQLSPNGGQQRLDPYQAAPLLANAITGYQKEQRATPFMEALKTLGDQWATANPEQQNDINMQASKVRGDYLASGGSPIDMPQELWGSDPNKGFQTGAGQFAPGYAGDNWSMGQKAQRAGVTGMFEGGLTWPAHVQNEGLNLERQGLQNQYSTSMAGINEQSRYHNMMDDQNQLQNKNYIATNTYINQVLGADGPEAAFDYLSKFGSQIAGQGADVASILKAMAMKWPEYFAKYSGSLDSSGGVPNPYMNMYPPQGEP